MKAVALWALAIALIILGFIGTVAPALPGILLIYAGMLLAAWIEHFSRIGWPTHLGLTASDVKQQIGHLDDARTARAGGTEPKPGQTVKLVR